METIDPINLSRERNDGHYEFSIKVYEMANEYPELVVFWAAQLPPYQAAIAVELFLLNFDRKSVITKQIKAADKRMDNAITGMRAIAFGFLHNFDPAKAEAAELIYDRLKSFKAIRTRPMEEESAAVQVLVQDMRVKFKDETPLLGLTEWVNDLETARILFDSLFDQRNTEWSNRPKETMVEARVVTEDIYYDMVGLLNAEIKLNGDVKYASFVRRLNEQIKYYKEHEHHPERHDISHVVVAPIPVQTYTEEPVIVIPEVHYVEAGKPSKKLVFSVDYTVTYRDNTNVGTAELLLQGKGHYKGHKIITFNIARTL